MPSGQTPVEALKAAIANAAARQAEASSPDEADRWQAIINQNEGVLSRLIAAERD